MANSPKCFGLLYELNCQFKCLTMTYDVAMAVIAVFKPEVTMVATPLTVLCLMRPLYLSVINT
jgi:hypothetical protein